jgi:hypothetical protein
MPASSLEIKSSLELTHLRIRNIIQAVMRFQTSIPHIQFRQQLNRGTVTITSLEYLAKTFPHYSSHRIESIKRFARVPEWEPTDSIDISSNKIAKRRHDGATYNPSTLCIYTHGSSI